MFGVVPRVIWERLCPADELNRIRMNMNCVFVDTGREKVLIETGIGEKWTEKQTAMYGIDRKQPFADSLVEITGSRPEDITIVVNTHLHFDHAGGNTIGEETADPRPQFKNARYLVSKSEFAHANAPHERDRASYLPENWQPVVETGQMELMPDDYSPVDGLRLMTERGHSETMQTWRLDRGGKTVYGFADLIPMRHHVPLPFVAGFDLYPVETLDYKKRILPQAAEEEWMCLFYHDVDSPLAQLVEVDGKLRSIGIGI